MTWGLTGEEREERGGEAAGREGAGPGVAVGERKAVKGGGAGVEVEVEIEGEREEAEVETETEMIARGGKMMRKQKRGRKRDYPQ